MKDERIESVENFLIQRRDSATKFLNFFILVFILTCGCSRTSLSVHTDYLSHENLASYHIETPDPRLNNPPVGQRLIVRWCVPQNYLEFEDLHLEITIRFRNRQEVVEQLDLLKRRGTYVYPVLNEAYVASRGILTYKVDLVADGNVLEEWRHQMWVDLITIGEDKELPCNDALDEDSK